MKPPRLFVNREAPPKRRSQTLEDFARTYKGAFSSLEDTQHYFAHLFTPASRRWLYAGNGKSGTTSTKRFLFELEFGIPLTVHLVAEHDINSDAQSHMLAKAGIFRPLTALPDAIKVFNTALRITTARHPVARALSSFRYLCLSDQLKHSWLVSDRMRMNAMVGFDWNRDPDTNGGFRKFLQYAELSMSTQGDRPNDPHWRCQVDNIRPEVLRPHIVGRTERLADFFRTVAEHLGNKLPDDMVFPNTNKQSYPPGYAEAILDMETLRTLGDVFRRDFDWLNETPDSWKR